MKANANAVMNPFTQSALHFLFDVDKKAGGWSHLVGEGLLFGSFR